MCSNKYFKQHPRPYVLPASEEPDGENLVPLSEYDYGDEINREKERIDATSAGGGPEPEARQTSNESQVGKEPDADNVGTIIQQTEGCLLWNQVEDVRSLAGGDSTALIVVIDEEVSARGDAHEIREDVILEEADCIRARRRGLIDRT